MNRHGLVILVPVLARPHRVEPLVAAFRAATSVPHRIVFIADQDDRDEIHAVLRSDAELLRVRSGSSYAAKITVGVRATTERLIFLGADDLVPQRGWFDAALEQLTGPVQVVGVNDLIPRRKPGRREHATHFLMTRAYAEQPTLDGRPGPLSDAYRHNFCDDELIATARHRGVYAYAPASHVRHEHPMTGTAEDDETYRKGRRHFRHDRRTFEARTRLWT